MSHKTLVNGTSYNIISGKTLISGTSYNISKGKSLISGTSYNINFGPPSVAILYTDGTFTVQKEEIIEPGKSVLNTYKGFSNKIISGGPWSSYDKNYIKTVKFDNSYGGTQMYEWFKDSQSLKNADCGLYIENMSGAYSNCTNLTTAVCGDNVTSMAYAYYNCRNLTAAVCGDRV